MADLNDLTVDVNIWDDAKTKAVDVVTDISGVNRLAVDASIEFRDDAVITMDHWLRKLYDGQVFSITDYFPKSNDQYRYILLKVPSGYNGYIRWQIASELGVEFEVYENPTITANGTAHPTYNLNRASSTTPQISAYYDSTISAEGTRIYTQLLPGSNQSSSIGASSSTIVLKENEDYLIKLVSRGNGNDIGYEINWFEEVSS